VGETLAQLVVQRSPKDPFRQRVAAGLVGELHDFDPCPAKPCLRIVAEEQQGHVAWDRVSVDAGDDLHGAVGMLGVLVIAKVTKVTPDCVQELPNQAEAEIIVARRVRAPVVEWHPRGVNRAAQEFFDADGEMRSHGLFESRCWARKVR